MVDPRHVFLSGQCCVDGTVNMHTVRRNSLSFSSAYVVSFQCIPTVLILLGASLFDVDLVLTVNFQSVNFTCTCTIIFQFNELDEPSSYLFDERWRQQRQIPPVDTG